MLKNVFPEWLALTGETQTLRRKRIVSTRHRQWEILPRYGSADTDRWTVVGTPIPGPTNPARDIEDGQFSSLAEAYAAREQCIRLDDGTHEED